MIFFARFHIVCDRYTSDYAHFTFSDTTWPLLLSSNFGTQMITLAETATYQKLKQIIIKIWSWWNCLKQMMFTVLGNGVQILLLQFWLCHSLRSYHNMSPPDIWKWKWSNGVGKSEMSIIWCISITNNVKSNKKFNETAQTANFTVSTIYRRELCVTLSSQNSASKRCSMEIH